MKTTAITSLIVILAIILVIAGIVVMYPGHMIDLYETDTYSHTFGYWKGGAFSKNVMGQEPDLAIEIPINPYTRNYEGNPSSVTLAMYLAKCVNDTSYMNVKKYREFVKQNTQ